MKKLILFMALCAPLAVLAQNNLDSPDTPPVQGDNDPTIHDAPKPPAPGAAEQDQVFNLVDEMPQFPGGQNALTEYLVRNIRYPEDARELAIQGKVYLSFLVDTQGQVTNVKILRSVYPSLDKEALRVVKMMPQWVPGKQNGKPVIVQFNLPINFKLQ